MEICLWPGSEINKSVGDVLLFVCSAMAAFATNAVFIKLVTPECINFLLNFSFLPSKQLNVMPENKMHHFLSKFPNLSGKDLQHTRCLEQQK